MADPIRPDDPSCVAEEQANGSVTAVEGVAYMHAMALREAIHQTFERDVINVQFVDSVLEANRADVQRWQQGSMLDAMPEPDLSKTIPDPDTEIDRLARLIVQGEYRRRQIEDQKGATG